MALEQQKGISALDDRSRLDKIRDFMAEAAQSQTRAAQAKQEALQAIQPTAAQTAYLGSVFAPVQVLWMPQAVFLPFRAVM